MRLFPYSIMFVTTLRVDKVLSIHPRFTHVCRQSTYIQLYKTDSKDSFLNFVFRREGITLKPFPPNLNFFSLIFYTFRLKLNMSQTNIEHS